jgi:hypothetical protein
MKDKLTCAKVEWGMGIGMLAKDRETTLRNILLILSCYCDDSTYTHMHVDA